MPTSKPWPPIDIGSGPGYFGMKRGTLIAGWPPMAIDDVADDPVYVQHLSPARCNGSAARSRGLLPA